MRWDGGIVAGSNVSLHYDPMLAKLIVHAPTRELAISRMHRALLELAIVGVETSRDFHLRVMEDPEFQAGAIEIQWLERRLPSLAQVTGTPDGERLAAMAAALMADAERGRPTLPERNAPATAAPASAWQRAARREALR